MPAAHPHAGPALAMLDIGDVPFGLLALDALAKEAEVEVISRGTVQSGRYFILFGGQVEPVQRAFDKAAAASGPSLVDAVLLPYAEARITPAIRDGKTRWPAPGDTLGVLQNGTPPTLLRAVDAALKGALVDLVQLRIGDGLGGKGIALLWGETPDVEAAVEIADGTLTSGHADRWTSVVIRNADAEVAGALQPKTQFFREWRG